MGGEINGWVGRQMRMLQLPSKESESCSRRVSRSPIDDWAAVCRFEIVTKCYSDSTKTVK